MDFVKQWLQPSEQMGKAGRHSWSVARLIELSRDLPLLKIPLKHMSMFYKYEEMDLREMCGHYLAIKNADLSYPIILDEDGDIIDGRHRLMKAIVTGKKTILAVRFMENPPPCRVEEEE